MGRQKAIRFEENKERVNIIEPSKALYQTIKGKWHSQYFDNDHPIHLELACGRGEYTNGLAEAYPDENFIGVDIKGDRLWKGSTKSLELEQKNTAFLRTHILHLDQFFAPKEVDSIWIVFPDPRPKSRDEKRRLTAPRYLELYKQLLKDGGWIRLKTDNTALYEFTLETLSVRNDIYSLEHTDNLYQSYLNEEHLGIKTRFEEIFVKKGENIKYIKFRMKNK